MSKTIDEKVVEMRFDNKDFEKNVSKSLKTIDELKFKLQTMDFRTSIKGLEDVNKTAKNLDMSPLSNGIETIQAKFSALQIIGITALQNITNSAINAGKQIANSLTNSLIEGGKQRALKIKDAKFQMEGLLGTEEYKKQWDRIDESINYAVKDTAYGYDSAARAASQFLASNVKVGEEMDRSLRAISGVAAMTNSTYDDISNIFTRISGQGRVMAIDLNSLAARGLNAAAILGKSMGKTEAQIRDMVSKGKVSFNDFAKAMDDAFGAHAKKGNETFSGSLANMKAAMSRIGAKIWDPLLDNERDVFNQMRLLINDLNSNYLDGPIKTLNSKLTDTFQTIVAFFEKGGVKNVLLGIGNVLQFLASVIKPVKEAFREIFPKKSVDTLVEYTVKFKDLTEKMKLSEESTNNIKNIFKGLFSAINTGIEIIIKFVNATGKILSNLTGIPGGILGVLGAFGEWVTKISETISKSTLFNKVLEKMVQIFEKIINKVKEFINNFDIFGTISNVISKIFNLVKSGFEYIISHTGNLNSLLKSMNTGIFGLILISISNITKSLDLFFRKVEKFNEVGNIGQILATLKTNLYELSFNIKAKTLMTIAKALVLLAAGVWILSTIDPASLAKSLGGISLLMYGLTKTFSSFVEVINKMDKNASMFKASAFIISISAALLIMAGALKILSTIDFWGMIRALAMMVIGLRALIQTVQMLPEKDVRKAAKSLKIISGALILYAISMKILSTIDWKQMIVALGGMAVGLYTMVKTINNINPEKAISKGFAMIELAHALILLSLSLKILSTIDWKQMLVAVGGMGASLLLMVGSLNLLNPEKAISKGFAMIELAHALILLSLSLKILSTIDWKQMLVAVGGVGAVLFELVTAINMMKGGKDGILGALGLSLLVDSLLSLAIVMKVLGGMKIGDIGKALIAIAGAFIVLGVAGSVLAPIAPSLLAIAGAMALFGLAAIALGAGITSIAIGLGTLKAQFIGNIDLILASIKMLIVGFAKMLPELIVAFKDIILALIDTVVETAPALVNGFLTVFSETLKQLDQYMPLIVNTLITFIIKVIDELTNRVPELISSIIKLINAIFNGFKKAIEDLDPGIISSIIENIKSLSIIFIALAGLSKLFPSAMAGVLEFGVLVVELGAVLAVLGGLSKIPGLNTIIGEGGNLLQTIGTAIGKFTGGILAGIAAGATSTLGEIGTNLSDFMNNVSDFIKGINNIPDNIIDKINLLSLAIIELTKSNFINGLSKISGSNLSKMGSELSEFINNLNPFLDKLMYIDPKSLNGIGYLSDILLKLTKAEFINSISSFSLLPGKSSLKDFGKDLGHLAKGINNFIDKIGDLSEKQVRSSKVACELLYILARASSSIKGEGGISSIFSGEKDLNGFALRLPILGIGLNLFIKSLGDLKDDSLANVKTACEILKTLVDISKEIPNQGGLASLFTGDNTLGQFSTQIPKVGEGIKSFADSLNGIQPEAITNVKTACEILKTLVDISKEIPNQGGVFSWIVGDNSLELFSSQIPKVGEGIKSFADSLNGIQPEAITNVNTACEILKTLIDISKEIPNQGGVFSWIVGDNSLELFSSQIPKVGEGIKSFADSLNGIQPEAITNVKTACEILKTLVDISKEIPNQGGVFSWIVGDNSLELFSSQIPKVGEGIKSFADSLNGVQPNAITNVKTACEILKTLVDVSNNIPDQGGWLTKIYGDNNLGLFSKQIPILGKGIKSFANSLSGVQSEAITNVKTACDILKVLVQVSNDIPNQGGWLTKIFGDNTADKFGKQLPSLGKGIGSFIEPLKNLDPNSVNSAKLACEVLKELINVSKDIPETGGLLSAIYGNINPEEFGSKMPMLGYGIKAFSESVKGFDDKLLESMKYGIDALSSLIKATNEIEITTGGFLQKFTGEIDIEGFATKLPLLGTGLSGFVTNLGTFTSEQLETTKTACEGFLNIMNAISISNQNGGLKNLSSGKNDLEGFSEKIPLLGKGLHGFIDSLGAFSQEQLDVVNYAISALYGISSLNSLDLVSLSSNLKDFGYSITMLGSDVYSFTSTISEIGVDTIQAAINKINDIVAMATNIASVSIESLSTFSTSLVQVATDGVNNFCLAFSGPEPVEQVKEAIIMLIDALITAIDSKKQDIYNKFIELMNKALEAMRSKKTEFVNVTIELCNAVLDTFSNYYDAMYQVGCDFTMGFVEGMRSKIEEAARAAAEMARAALQAAKAAIDSNSPSKETMALGGFFGEGFMLGIKSYSRKVYNEAYNVGDTAKDGLSRAISKISSIIDSGIETSPTIRPVLDLSDLESGVSRIDSMFNNGAVALNGNVDSISNNFKLRSQNGLNNSVEEAINNLSDKLQGLSGNTLNIYTQELDSNKLDQIVVYVDRQLGIKYLVK